MDNVGLMLPQVNKKAAMNLTLQIEVYAFHIIAADFEMIT